MNVSIKHINELPHWFDLAKYDSTNKLDAAGWYEQLIVRHGVLFYFINNRKTRSKSFETALKKLFETPIIDLMADRELEVLFANGQLQELRSKNIRYTLGVHMTTVRQHYQTEFNTEIEKRNYARNFFKDVYEEDWDKILSDGKLRYPCQDWIDEPIDNIRSDAHNYFLNINVNMALPDKVLIEQFTKLVAGLRAVLDEGGVSIHSKLRIDFENWTKFAVLPFIDLSIWAMSEGKKIPNRVMADAIFKMGEGGEEVVRKTTQKLADLILIDSHLGKLAAIAAQEIAEQNNL